MKDKTFNYNFFLPLDSFYNSRLYSKTFIGCSGGAPGPLSKVRFDKYIVSVNVIKYWNCIELIIAKSPEFQHFNATIIALKIVPENKTKKYQKTISN